MLLKRHFYMYAHIRCSLCYCTNWNINRKKIVLSFFFPHFKIWIDMECVSMFSFSIGSKSCIGLFIIFFSLHLWIQRKIILKMNVLFNPRCSAIHRFRDSVLVLILHSCYYDMKNFEQIIQFGSSSEGERCNMRDISKWK